jgi:hypothetical protein
MLISRVQWVNIVQSGRGRGTWNNQGNNEGELKAGKSAAGTEKQKRRSDEDGKAAGERLWQKQQKQQQ